jgi:hypothetical protein
MCKIQVSATEELPTRNINIYTYMYMLLETYYRNPGQSRSFSSENFEQLSTIQREINISKVEKSESKQGCPMSRKGNK